MNQDSCLGTTGSSECSFEVTADPVDGIETGRYMALVTASNVSELAERSDARHSAEPWETSPEGRTGDEETEW